MISSTISISSSEAFLPVNLPDKSQAPSHVRVIEGENLIAYARPLYTSVDKPANHEVPSNDPHDGVAKLILTRTDGTFGCTGTLANDNIHVFTAAHCVTDDDGNYILTSGTATFEGNSESITILIDVSKSFSHPDYDGDFIKGNDIAILKLVSSPDGVPGINHATSGSAVGTQVDKTGYGLSGKFRTGTDSSYPFGTQRDGQNTYDAFADTMYSAFPNLDFIPEAIYQFDSDNGRSSNDAFGIFFGISDTGLGNDEVMSAPGDSGGPTFSNGELIGITSYGLTLFLNGETSDCTGRFQIELDSSCGEFGGDTRVSVYSSWIDDIISGGGGGDTTAPTVSSATTVTTTTIDLTASETVTSNADADDFTVNGIGANTVGTVAASGTTITLTLSTGSISDTDVITVDYTRVTGSIIDSSSNIMDDFAGQSVTNNLDTTLPTIISSTTTSTTTIDLTASETVTSNADADDFTVNGIGANTVGTVAASGTTITLTLSTGSISDTDVITVDYTRVTGSIIDSSSNIMDDFAGQSVTNNLGGGDAVTVTAISEDVIVKGATLSDVEITGSGFKIGASVTFENGCGPSPTASIVDVSDGKITVNITAKSGGPPRSCTFDVRVTNEDTSTNVLPDSFTVGPP